MSIQRRLLLGFVVILSLFMANLAIHRWSSRRRDERFEALRRAMARNTSLAALRHRIGDLQKQMALLSEVYADSVSAGPSAEEMSRFAKEIDGVDRDLLDLERLAEPPTTGTVRALAKASRDLAWSWQQAFESFGTDNSRSIAELSRRADPLGQRVFHELLPLVEKEETQRLAEARDGFYGVARFTDGVTAAIFLLSAAAGVFVAANLSGYVVALNRAQEQRVRERTKELEESLSLLRATLESTADGILVIDAEGRVRSFNKRFAELCGIPPDSLGREAEGGVQRAVLPLLVDPVAFRGRLEAVREQPEKELDEVLRFKDGREFEVRSKPQRLEGATVGSVLSFRDVTQRHRVEAALRASEDRYALAARGANDGLWDWDLRARRAYYSPRWKSMLGHEEEEVGGAPREWLGRVHPDDRDWLGMAIVAHLEGLTPHFEHEHRLRHQDGGYRWMLARGLAVRDAGGEAVRMAGSLTDITVRKAAEEQLLHDAFHDGLTGLPNRALFMDRLAQTLARGRAQARRGRESSFAVLFLDVDRFKIVNDGLGHAVGDQLLVSVAHRILACLRPNDTVARLGGDEFTVLLDDIRGGADARLVADRIQEALAQPYVLASQEVFTTASIGIALGPARYERADDLLRDADTAMYGAKTGGKARHALFDDEMRQHAVGILELETGLRRALDREELRLQYQPVVSLASGEVMGVEALLRWQHPRRGLLTAKDFVPAAEETGLIVPIGVWVLREACREVRGWDEILGRELTVSVNVSGRQFMQPSLVDEVRRILEETKLPPHRLCLEITENAIMENTESARQTLAQLRDLDVRLHMDDFGTGYSSMSYLRDFSIDVLKIDQSFVGHMGASGEHSEIVRTIVGLGHSLRMEVVAEGIENEGHVAQLKALGCEYGQGFYFSRPVGPAEARALAGKTPSWLPS